MNLASFVDEMLKLGSATVLAKVAGEIDSTSNVNTTDPPMALMGGGAVPASLRIVPERAATRLPSVDDVDSQIEPGSLGEVTGAKAPIDRDKFNRWYRDKR